MASVKPCNQITQNINMILTVWKKVIFHVFEFYLKWKKEKKVC